MSGSATPDPATASNPVEFIAMLRELREISGLTYRQIQRRAEGLQLTLPPSTLATMLGRDTLPREELVSTMVRCCGEEPEPWLSAHGRLRQEQRRPARVIEPAPPPQRFRYRRSMIAVALISIMALLGLSAEGVEPRQMTKMETPVAPGPIRIVSAHTGLCLTGIRQDRDGWLYQRPCGGHIVPTRTLIGFGDGYYRIYTDHYWFGSGCLGYDPAYHGFRPGDGQCEVMQSQVLELIEVTVPRAGHLVRFVDLNQCMTLADSVFGHVVFAECDKNSAAQIFLFESRG